MTDEHERLLRIAQTTRGEIARRLLRIGRPASAVLLWLSVHDDEVVGIDVFGHPVLLEELAKHDPAIDHLLASPPRSGTVRVVVDDRARARRAAGHIRIGLASGAKRRGDESTRLRDHPSWSRRR